MEEEDDGFDHINANINEGLNDEQVIYRIKEGFINEDSNSESKSILKIVLSKVFTVFNVISFAIAAIIIGLAVKDGESFFDTVKDLIFLFIMFANMIIGIITEVKSKQLIDKLSFDTNSTITVIRNGNEILIPSEEHHLNLMKFLLNFLNTKKSLKFLQ